MTLASACLDIGWRLALVGVALVALVFAFAARIGVRCPRCRGRVAQLSYGFSRKNLRRSLHAIWCPGCRAFIRAERTDGVLTEIRRDAG